MPSRRSPPPRTFAGVLLALIRPFLFWAVAYQRRKAGVPKARRAPREALPESRPDPAVRALQSTSGALAEMQERLRLVLDAEKTHRGTYRHLDRFERKFARHGLTTIERLPVDQVRRALAEFEALVRNWSQPSLADLRSRMAVVLADRSSAASVWIAANSVHGAQRHGPGTAAIGSTRLRGGGTTPVGGASGRASVRASGNHVGMSRFEWADHGFHSTSSPA